MCELLELRGDERVLDVGTGSGYHAARARAARRARVDASSATPRCREQAAAQPRARRGSTNVTLVVGDGARGLPEHAPFDAINVAAAAGDEVPHGAARSSSAPGGRLVAPVEDGDQRLVLLRRTPARARAHATLERVRFVPLVS